MGFVRDAENKPAKNAYESIISILQKKDYIYPNSAGLIKNDDGMKIGIFIMPNNTEEGMLEDLCLQSIEQEPIKFCIDSYIKCVTSADDNVDFSKFNESKARTLSYLASRIPISDRLGLAAEKGHWNFNHACFDKIKDFLKSLFSK